jgi:hypothetical protein
MGISNFLVFSYANLACKNNNPKKEEEVESKQIKSRLIIVKNDISSKAIIVP